MIAVWNPYASAFISGSDIDSRKCGLKIAAMERAMRIFTPSDEKRSELRAVLPVAAVLTVAMLAKLGTVGLFLHLAH
jgi:hypothetical protein